MMDSTLAQILESLYGALAERDQLRARIAQLEKVIESKLPVVERTTEDIAAGVEIIPNGDGPQAIAK